MTTPTLAERGRMVVARFMDGTILTGTTHDFAPGKAEFHLYEGGNERARATAIRTESLKALFFVKSYEGDSEHKASYEFDASVVQGGRRVRVRFKDGEEMAGFTTGYNSRKQGFFFIPADPTGNNTRVYVLNSAVDAVEWVQTAGL